MSPKDQQESRTLVHIVWSQIFRFYIHAGMWISITEYVIHTLCGMLIQQSRMTERGNGTISLLTGKSCHSLTKSQAENGLGSICHLHTDYRRQKAMNTIWTRAGVCDRTLTSSHTLTAIRESTSGVCLCSNTECEQLLDGIEAEIWWQARQAYSKWKHTPT